MTSEHVLIIGGGLAGLSAGCYALASGYRTTIVEHNLALGGVCTAWSRGPYTIDGCIHWLTGGPFCRIYEELGILPKVGLHTLNHYATYRHVRDGIEIPITRDLGALGQALYASRRRIRKRSGASSPRLRSIGWKSTCPVAVADGRPTQESLLSLRG